jgi:hypothetical protein
MGRFRRWLNDLALSRKFLFMVRNSHGAMARALSLW